MNARALNIITTTNLLLLLMFVLAPSAGAQVNYAISGSTAYVTNSSSASGNITIASSYEGFPVTSISSSAFYNSALTGIVIPNSITSIGMNAFYNCFGLTSVTIPSSVTSISDTAFFVCTDLTSVIISNGVTSIGVDAFYQCSSLASIAIPASVTNIGTEGFAFCTSLTNISVDAENLLYSSTNGSLFNKSQTTLIQFPGGLGGNYAISNGVRSISDYAFQDCINLKSVAIGNSVTNLGNYTFAFCAGLTNVTLPNSITSISNYVFEDCFSLTHADIPNSVTSIGMSAFQECTNLTSVTIPDSVTSIGGNAFEACINLVNAVIGRGVTNISSTGVFQVCQNLTSVTFLGNAPTVNSTAFAGDGRVTVYYTPGTSGWATFANNARVAIAPSFGLTAYGGYPTLFYPTTGATNVLQMSTNPSADNWVTVSNAVTLIALQLTNPPANAFFRVQSSGGTPPGPGLVFYFNLPVLFYPTNAAYSLMMSTNVPPLTWSAPSGNAFIAVQITNAPPGTAFRLY